MIDNRALQTSIQKYDTIMRYVLQFINFFFHVSFRMFHFKLPGYFIQILTSEISNEENCKHLTAFCKKKK